METSRELDKSLIANLATVDYIAKGEAVVVSGSTATGKSFSASALGHHVYTSCTWQRISKFCFFLKLTLSCRKIMTSKNYFSSDKIRPDANLLNVIIVLVIIIIPIYPGVS
jgi:DNA replication protein DnaC